MLIMVGGANWAVQVATSEHTFQTKIPLRTGKATGGNLFAYTM
jgi:hypothetical protein